MPWDTRSAMSLRNEFVIFASQDGANIRALCQRFGIAPATAYKWLHRFQSEGAPGLAERSRKPHISPSRTPDIVTSLVLAAAVEHPIWGARKLKRLLENRGHVVPSASTVHAILQRHGLHLSRAVPPVSVGRFEHDAPNRLWQMDFKGHFPFAEGRSHPLTILDDHSRFSLCLRHCQNERYMTVQSQLVAVFERYGLPERMTMDNGSPWGDTTGTWTALELWLMRQGIRVGHSRPYHPQTQGKLERFHRSLKAEVLQNRWFLSAEALQRVFDRWRDEYNLTRPHEALGMNVPASRYQPSKRQYEAHQQDAEYGAMQVRKVDMSGKFSLNGVSLKAGNAFKGERIGIREGTEEGCYDVWWYSTKVGVIDLRKRSITMGKTC